MSKSDHNFFKADSDYTPKTSSEQNLWLATLIQALIEGQKETKDGYEDVNWIFSEDTDSPSFIWICDELDICPHTLRKRFLSKELVLVEQMRIHFAVFFTRLPNSPPLKSVQRIKKVRKCKNSTPNL